ncbi:MAG: toxin-antitoxin system, antitoxin component [Elusimicrobia bacterium]|nr:toxin-antitoxin system, antitoxin component [Elusimicrobiota bacterium]
MAQLTVYIDDKTLKQIDIAAKREHTSISKWVKVRLSTALETKWPAHYFDLFGSLSKEDLERPKQLDFSKDTRRGTL